MNCRICSSANPTSTTFGRMPIANGFLEEKDFDKEYFFEMKTTFCDSCKTYQLVEQPDPKMMFHNNYAFFSSTSKNMAIHFEKMAHHYIQNFIPNKENAFVMELGSNDGIMLKHFAQAGIKHLGIEPSSNVAEVARESGVNTISEFFNFELASTLKARYGKADIISASNVICHIPDLNSVGKGVEILLKENGVFIFEDPYLGSVISQTSYDQIYDEHVYIFSVMAVQNIFSPYNLKVFHIEPQTTHGGSMRYYLCREGASHKIQDSVKNQLKIENELELEKKETYENFTHSCKKSKTALVELLTKFKTEGKRVVGYAATSKSTTVLNYCNIGPDLIEYICDTTPLKQGKFSPGMHIPIRSHEEFQKDRPDYAVLFAWNHAEEIFAKEKNFLAQGGRWIVFVPKTEVL